MNTSRVFITAAAIVLLAASPILPGSGRSSPRETEALSLDAINRLDPLDPPIPAPATNCDAAAMMVAEVDTAETLCGKFSIADKPMLSAVIRLATSCQISDAKEMGVRGEALFLRRMIPLGTAEACAAFISGLR